MPDSPPQHFDFPFRFNKAGGHAAIVDQDSDADLIACAQAILATPIGFREELPDFGVEPLNFEEQPQVIAERVKGALDRWEDRGDWTSDAINDAVDTLRTNVDANLMTRSDA